MVLTPEKIGIGMIGSSIILSYISFYNMVPTNNMIYRVKDYLYGMLTGTLMSTGTTMVIYGSLISSRW